MPVCVAVGRNIDHFPKHNARHLPVTQDHAALKGDAAEIVAPQMHSVIEGERRDLLPPLFATLLSPRP